MFPIITLRARQVAGCALLLVLVLAALIAVHQGHTLLWQPLTDPMTSGGTDAGLVITPAALDGAH